MFKKIFFKALLMCAFFFGLGSYASYLMTGKVPVFNEDLVGKITHAANNAWDDAGKAADDLVDHVKESEPVQPQVVYRWIDPATAETNYGSEPPPNALNVEQLGDLESKITVVDLPEPRAREEQVDAPAASPGSSSNALSTENINPYSVEGAKQLMEQAKQVEKVLQQRATQQRDQMNQY